MNPTHTHAALKLTRRLRRLRTSETMRALVRETRLSPDMFMLPLFVCEGEGVRREVPSMPGVFNLSVDEAVKETAAAHADGVKSVLLFGLPDHKDDVGSAAYDPEAPVQSAIRAIKREVPDALVITDVCLCEYTDHGHCGIVDRRRDRQRSDGRSAGARGGVARGRRRRHRRAVGHDGRPRRRDPRGARRARASRTSRSCRTRRSTARRSTVRSATRRSRRRSSAIAARTRWIPANALEALREVEQDIEEGADIVMVKPALPYLDVITRVKDTFGYPTAAYHVSGEYAMLKAAARNGWIDERRAMLETLTAIRRAGADIIITYYAREAARAL